MSAKAEVLAWLPDIRVTAQVRILAEVLDYNHRMMNIPSMWRSTRGKGVKVAILDTGLPKHVDLKPTGAKSFVKGYLEDQNGHSTHCGGIIAAVANNGMGVAGIAPDCETWYGAVLGASGGGTIDGIVKGIYWAVDEVGADIISMSLGCAPAPRLGELEKACNYAVGKGVAVFAAAGNEAGKVGQPALFDSVIAVAAIDSAEKHAEFSNMGKEVDFATGGVDVYSTYLGNTYAKLSGTSMACPALAAVGALIKAEHKDRGENLTPAQLKDHIQRICFDIESPGFDSLTGSGVPIFGVDNPYIPATQPVTLPPSAPAPVFGKRGFDPECVHWKLLSVLVKETDVAVRTGKVRPEQAFAHLLKLAARHMTGVETAAVAKLAKGG